MVPDDAAILSDLPALRRFVAVAEAGGFTAASRQLGLTVNQVSRAVQRLEDTVGVALLHRTTRSVSLTADGERLLAPARRVLAAVAEAEAALRVAPSDLSGRLRVAMPSTVAVAGVLEPLGRWIADHPELRLDVTVSDEPLDVVAAGLDVQLRFSIPSRPDVLFRRVATFTAGLAAHPSYLERRGPVTDPADLADHDCLRFLADGPEETWSLVPADGGYRRDVTVGGRFSCDSGLALREALLAGLGIGPRPPGVAPTDRAATTELVDVLPGWTFEPRPLWAVQPPLHRRQAAVAPFLAECAAVLDQLSD